MVADLQTVDGLNGTLADLERWLVGTASRSDSATVDVRDPEARQVPEAGGPVLAIGVRI